MLWTRWMNLGRGGLSALVCCTLLACSGDDGSSAPVSPPPDAPASDGSDASEANSGEAAADAATTDADPAAASSENPSGLSSALTSLLTGLSAEDRAKTNPLSGAAEAVAAGRSEYMSMCFVCHGAAGKGDGPAAGATPTRPSDLSDGARAALLSDGDRFAVLRNGIPGTSMPASGANLNDDQVWRILAYVETLVAK
jgi:high-affinity iron transporter